MKEIWEERNMYMKISREEVYEKMKIRGRERNMKAIIEANEEKEKWKQCEENEASEIWMKNSNNMAMKLNSHEKLISKRKQKRRRKMKSIESGSQAYQ